MSLVLGTRPRPIESPDRLTHERTNERTNEETRPTKDGERAGFMGRAYTHKHKDSAGVEE